MRKLAWVALLGMAAVHCEKKRSVTVGDKPIPTTLPDQSDSEKASPAPVLTWESDVALELRAEVVSQEGFFLRDIAPFDFGISGTAASEARLELVSSTCPELFFVQGARLVHVAAAVRGPRECVVRLRAVAGAVHSNEVEVRVALQRRDLELELVGAVQRVVQGATPAPIEATVRHALDPAMVTLLLSEESCPGFFRVQGRSLLVDVSRAAGAAVCRANVAAKEGDFVSPKAPVEVSFEPPPHVPQLVIAVDGSSLVLPAGSPAVVLPVKKISGPNGVLDLVRAPITNWADPCIPLFKVENGAVRVEVPREFRQVGIRCTLKFSAKVGQVTSNEIQIDVRVGEPEKTLADHCKDATLAPELRRPIDLFRQRMTPSLKRSGIIPWETQIVDCDRFEHELLREEFWKELNLSNIELLDLSLFKVLKGTRTLNVSGNPLKSLSGIEVWPELTNLKVEGCPNLADISALGAHPKLQILSLRGTKVVDLRALAPLPALDTLVLSDTPVADLEPLRNLKTLKHLYLERVHPENLLEVVAALPTLETLVIRDALWDASKLSVLKNLRILNLEDNGSMTSLPDSLQLPELQGLFLSGSMLSGIRNDFGRRHPKLKILTLPRSLACPEGFEARDNNRNMMLCHKTGW